MNDLPSAVVRYPYVETASGAKPIVWVAIYANDLYTPLPAAPSPERMRTGLSPRAAGAVDFSDSQAVELQFLTNEGRGVGKRIQLVPELDPRLDEAAQVNAPQPWFQYEQLALGQDFLQHFWLTLVGPRRQTAIYEE